MALVAVGAGILITGIGKELMGVDLMGRGTGEGLLGMGEMRLDGTDTGVDLIAGSFPREETFSEKKNTYNFFE